MSPSTQLLVNVILLVVALFSIGLILWGVALIYKSALVSESWLPTFASVVNGVLFPLVVIFTLLTFGAFAQQGGAAPTSRFRMPLETNSDTETGWSYVIGGVVILFGCIALAVR